MIRRRGTSYLVAAGTALLILVFVTFMIGFAVLMLTALTNGVEGRPTSDDGGPPPAFAFMFLGNLVAIPIGLALLATYLIDIFRNPDLAENQDRRILWALLVAFLGAWAMSVYWWLHLRPGSPSFRSRAASGAAPIVVPRAVRILGLCLATAPIALIMGRALLNDPGRIGKVSAASDAPLAFFLVIGLIVSALMVVAWALSTFRLRTPVLLVQLIVVWVGGLLYAFGVRTHVTGWDVAEDGVLLMTALLQLIPDNKARGAGRADEGERPAPEPDSVCGS